MLSGLTRYRLGWRGKMVLQVSEWRREWIAGRAPWLDTYRAVWRDATFQDVLDLERRNFSDEAPVVEPMPMPPRRTRESDLADVGMEAAFPRDGHEGSTPD